MTDTKYLWEDTPAGVLCWHIHHDTLLEVSIEPLVCRATFIRRHKSAAEAEVRLRAMRPVVGTVPEPVVEAAKAYGTAVKAYAEAWKARAETWKAYITMIKAHHSELEALHAAECPDCPWDGWTLFPSKRLM